MGQGQSCSDLNEFGNACEMHCCIEKIRGLDSKGSSPSDLWIVFFKDGTKYDDVNIKNGFMKVFVDPSEFRSDLPLTHKLQRLSYEVKVYKHIVRPLIDYHVCPNFIKYLGSGNRCGYKDMIKLLEGHIYRSNQPIPTENVEENFQVNVQSLLSGQYRPSIGNREGHTVDSKNANMVKQLHYNILVNELVKSGTTDYDMWTIRQDINKNSPTFLNKEQWGVIFQVIIACYALTLAKTSHNDLHLGNIWVEPYSQPLNYILGSNKKAYNVNIGYKVLLYDFDNSYSKRLGKNIGKSNEIIPNKDMIHFLSQVCLNLHDNIKEQIIGVIAKDGYREEVRDLIDDYERTFTSDEYENYCNTAEDILDKIADLSETRVSISDVLSDVNNLYVCIPDYFDRTGKIVVNKSRSYVQQSESVPELKQEIVKLRNKLKQKDKEILELKYEISDLERLVS